ncbi:hypothetical protein Tco_0109100 [Tanacetum coccineum]
MAPRAVLMKTGLKSVNTARPVNTIRSVNTDQGDLFKTQAQSTVSHPFIREQHLTKGVLIKWFNELRLLAFGLEAKERVIDHVTKNNIASVTLKSTYSSKNHKEDHVSNGLGYHKSMIFRSLVAAEA